MQETTVRRVVILAVCVCGVVALWLIADRAVHRPDSAGGSLPSATGTGVVSPTGHRPGSENGAGKNGSGQNDSGASATPIGTDTGPSDPHRPPHADASSGDHTPPPVVPGLHVISSTYESVTVGWDAVHDRSGIGYYRVTLNGIPAGETGGRQLTLDWFNDDMTSHFIQVWAYDNAGNRSPRAVPVMVTRPEPPSSGPQPPHRPTRPHRPSQPTRPEPPSKPAGPAEHTVRPQPSKPQTSQTPQPEPESSSPAEPKPKPTPTPTPTPSPTPTPTPTPSPSPSPSGSPTGSSSPSGSPSPSPGGSATGSQTGSEPNSWTGSESSPEPSTLESPTASPTPGDSSTG